MSAIRINVFITLFGLAACGSQGEMSAAPEKSTSAAATKTTTSAANGNTLAIAVSALGYTLPPGFSDPGNNGRKVPIWDPGAGVCQVVYAPTLKQSLEHRIEGWRWVARADNYFFYFPNDNVVLSYIWPRDYDWPKDHTNGKEGIGLRFTYPGGFPPGYGQLRNDTIGIYRRYNPDPSDKYWIVVNSNWPFIIRSTQNFDIPKFCSQNKECICIR